MTVAVVIALCALILSVLTLIVKGAFWFAEVKSDMKVMSKDITDISKEMRDVKKIPFMLMRLRTLEREAGIIVEELPATGSDGE